MDKMSLGFTDLNEEGLFLESWGEDNGPQQQQSGQGQSQQQCSSQRNSINDIGGFQPASLDDNLLEDVDANVDVGMSSNQDIVEKNESSAHKESTVKSGNFSVQNQNSEMINNFISSMLTSDSTAKLDDLPLEQEQDTCLSTSETQPPSCNLIPLVANNGSNRSNTLHSFNLNNDMKNDMMGSNFFLNSFVTAYADQTTSSSLLDKAGSFRECPSNALPQNQSYISSQNAATTNLQRQYPTSQTQQKQQQPLQNMMQLYRDTPHSQQQPSAPAPPQSQSLNSNNNNQQIFPRPSPYLVSSFTGDSPFTSWNMPSNMSSSTDTGNTTNSLIMQNNDTLSTNLNSNNNYNHIFTTHQPTSCNQGSDEQYHLPPNLDMISQYGMSVNGFHPLLNAQLNPTTIISNGSNQIKTTSTNTPIPSKNIHCNKKPKGKKNVREQQRAQKITDLIEQLRQTMVADGFKGDMRSKFHTLSTCVSYVRHLIQINKEKKEAVEKARADLQIRQRQIDDDNQMQDSKSDPESVISSLTAASSSGATTLNNNYSDDNSNLFSSNSSNNCDKSVGVAGMISNSSESEGGGSSTVEISNLNQKSIHPSSSDSTAVSSTAAVIYGVGSGCKRSFDQYCNNDKDTDINIEFDDDCIEHSNEENNIHDDDDDNEEKDEGIETSGMSRLSREWKNKRSELDYKEIFMKAITPQMIATYTGQIVISNDLFFNVTGLNKRTIDKTNLFSLVRVDKVSTLLHFVASGINEIQTKGSSNDIEEAATEQECKTTQEMSITLPCTAFKNSCSSLSMMMTVSVVPGPYTYHVSLHCILSSNKEDSIRNCVSTAVSDISQSSTVCCNNTVKTKVEEDDKND